MSIRSAARTLSTAAAILGVIACQADDVASPKIKAPEAPARARWSDPNTWPEGRVPEAGGVVLIPAEKNVLLDITPPPLKGLRIDGELAFADRDLALSTDWIAVFGRLEIGTEARPFMHRAVITLTGSDDSQDVFGIGAKALGVFANGTLEIHGEARLGWTRLAATARRSATQLILDAETDWRAGDRIVVASTDFDPMQAEEAVVESVSGSTVKLTTPLRFTHWGEIQTISGMTVDERGEVGLLTRNVVIRGDDASATSGFGGHIIVFEKGTARLEGVELYYMGQKRKVARYPFHWHMAAHVPGQYARGNSIWRSFNRCITVHGTHQAVVENNVCYDNLGHAYFLEDGIETKNRIARNLGVLTRVPAAADRILGSDSRAATFWITNPDNVVRDNHAAGSRGIGFWYALPEHPTGLSTNAAIWPRRTPLLEFAGNVAHSNSRTGLHVDDGPNPDGTTSGTSYRPRQDPASNSAAVVARFQNFVAFKHADRAVWFRGRDLRLSGATLADNVIGATFAASETFVEDAVIVGRTANSETAMPGTTPVRGYEFYDGRVAARRVVFANFLAAGSRPSSALSFLRNNPYTFNTANFAEGVTLLNANGFFIDSPRIDRDGTKNAVFLDADGSVTGTAGQYVAASAPILVTPACVRRSEWNAYVCPHKFVGLSVTGGGELVAPMDLTRDDGASVVLVGVGGNPAAANASVIVGRRYRVRFPGGPPSRTVVSLNRAAAGDGVTVGLALNALVKSVVRDNDAANPLAAEASRDAVETSNGDRYFYDSASGVLWIKATPRPGRESVSIAVTR